jgi:hypothetical protein
MTGAGRSQLNSALKRMERAGLIELGYRRVRLTDVAALQTLADPESDGF